MSMDCIGNVFGFNVDIPWEYKPELPCRSIIIPAITTGLPYMLLKAWVGTDPDHFVTSRSLFITQRLAFVLISLIIDWSIVKMARQIRRSPSIALLLVSTSYVTLAYHTHPFSNTVETLLLALSAVVLGKIIQEHDASTTVSPTASAKAASTAHMGPYISTSTAMPVSRSTAGPATGPYQPKPTPVLPSYLLGVLFAVGTFTRITFAVFGFPFGLMFLYLNARASFWKGRSILSGSIAFVRACMPLAVGLGSTSAAAIFIDSIYFGKLVISQDINGSPMTLWEILATGPQNWTSLSVQGSLTLTMWNNLQYNLDKDNLALHGLHPRFLHLLVNFPVLFANLAWIGVTTLASKVVAREWTSQSKLVTGLVPAMDLVQKQSLGFQNCQSVGSTMDHTLCTTDPSRPGAYHEKDGNTYTTRVVFYKTYMPPHHLLGYNPSQAQAHGIYLDIEDWRSKTKEELVQDLVFVDSSDQQQQGQADEGRRIPTAVDRRLLHAGREENRNSRRAVLFRRTSPGHYERTLLVAPGTVDFSDQAFDTDDTKHRISRHANLDHLPELIQNPLKGLSMNIYYI
ncbi:alpha 1,2 mannosyltransferase [Mortierella sp. AD031]|nr:alpha 1,2 mannosyltransferase [Mortierella sp. AD031]